MNKHNNSERFIDSGEGAIIELEPQCINCVNNLGLLNCKVYKKKPYEFISNETICPLFYEDTEES